MDNIVIFGAGNVLLSDEGFGVHFVRYLENNYTFPDNVKLFDAGTLGIMAMHVIEEADYLFIVDVVDVDGKPGEIRIYDKDDIILDRIPTKMSPHQIGLQEVLLLSEMRERLPKVVKLFGVIPENIEAGTTLSNSLEEKLPILAELLVKEIENIT
ncbi:hydrogenase maturation protease [Deferribacter autotrophicus]|uniref:Hydrogenase maturation protease n=1 Tax=Deferribacter autotrophicus TaxID=500465 RepID=A0A5A8F141_9BACT|nr:HyaD/HybD family hydrogenase maturation endopeptidase [Deferribacter autotrophicus]KAA0257788.1 hydrogenase maturation protease [Deferribacter autotrophicus]